MPSRRYQDPLAIAVAMALLPTALLLPPLLRCRFRRRATPERREAIPTETRSSIESSGLVSMTPIVPGIPPATLRTHPTSSTSSTRNTLRNPHPNSKNPICPPPPLSIPTKAGPSLAAAASPSFPSQPPPITNKPNYPPTNVTMTGALPPP